jgi:hypothetical protein
MGHGMIFRPAISHQDGEGKPVSTHFAIVAMMSTSYKSSPVGSMLWKDPIRA